MRFLFINQYYAPDYAATAQQLSDLCQCLVAQGHEIHVLAGTAFYDGRELPLASYEVLDGVHVHRVGMGHSSRKRIRDRLAGYVVFYLKAFLKIHVIPKPDVVITLTTPPLISMLGAWLKILKGTRYVYWVMDIYPDIAIRAGVLTNVGATRSLWAVFARLSYYFADRVVVLGRDMREALRDKQVPESLVEVVRSWADGEEIVPVMRGENTFRAEHIKDADFLVEYSGNLGTCHRATELIEGIRLLGDHSGIRFLFIGGGKLLPLVREALEGKLSNVEFLPYQPREELAESLSAADLHLITLDRKYDGLLVPSKVYGIMASGRPALLVGSRNSEAALLLVEHDCGIVVEQDDADGFARAVQYLHEHPEEADRMGANGRRAFEENFDKPVGARRFGEILEEVVRTAEAFDRRTEGELSAVHQRGERRRRMLLLATSRPALACFGVLILAWMIWQANSLNRAVAWDSVLMSGAQDPAKVLSEIPNTPAALRRATAVLNARMVAPPAGTMEALYARRIALEPMDSDAWLGIAKQRIFEARTEEGRTALAFADALNPAFPRERLRSLQHWVFLDDRQHAQDIANRTAALDFAGRLEAADALLSAGFLPMDVFEELEDPALPPIQTAKLLTRVLQKSAKENEDFFRSLPESFYQDDAARKYLLETSRASLPYDVCLKFWRDTAPKDSFSVTDVASQEVTILNKILLSNPRSEASFYGWQLERGPRGENVIWRRPGAGEEKGSLELRVAASSTGGTSWVFYRMPLPALENPVKIGIDVECSPSDGVESRLVAGCDGVFSRGTATNRSTIGWQRLETEIGPLKSPALCELILEFSRIAPAIRGEVTVRLTGVDVTGSGTSANQ